MPRNRKYYPHNAVLFCTSRTEEGLPFVASLVMNFILWGILARAKEKYNVRVCHFLFMANHFHMLLVVDDPAEVSRFIGYVKGESAHAVNRLLGRAQKTIWQDGYDSPVVLTAYDAMRYIRYLYLNPARADLEEHIQRYPGVSSWEMFSKGRSHRICKRLNRDSLFKLPSPALGVNEQRRMASSFENLPGSEHTFELEPDAWMECFPELEHQSVEETNAELVKSIEEEELKLSKERKANKLRVKGATSMRRESMTKEYVPEKRGRRMICICSEKDLRKAFITHFRHLCDEAKRVYQSWCLGERLCQIPPGLFAPCVPSLVSALPLRI